MLNHERGATAVLVAATMIVLIGMAAIAIDVGAGFNERRQDQTAADLSVMAGAINSVNGGTAVRTQVLDLAERNLSYTSAEEQALWENCVDPAAQRNTEPGDNFTALPAPTGWTLADPANWCISFDSAKGLLRVRVPDQITETSFAGVLGTDTLTTSAAAVSEVTFGSGSGGILPFGLPSTAGGGEHLCLSSGPAGNAQPPCTGGSAGNFGTIIIRQFGNVDLGTTPNCNASNPNNLLAQNIAVGADHIVVTDPDGLVANEVRDACFNPFVDTLNTDTGFPNNGAEQGLVGPVPGGFTPRLQLAGPTTNVFGNSVNDTPLWTYFLPISNGSNGNPDYGGGVTAAVSDDAPASCDPASFVAGTMDWDNDLVPDDVDGDGTPDEGDSWEHLVICFRQFNGDQNFDGDTTDPGDTGPYDQVIVDGSILSNTARFAYVPQFWESNLGNGSSWLHIQRFRAVYLQATTWKKGNTYVSHHPGQSCSCSGNGYSMRQLSAFTFPDAALPEDLRGDPIPGSTGLNPFNATLRR
jgi:hypothetical protein